MATNREWAMKMIPVLVRWAQATGDKPHYYSNLTAAVGHKTNQIGAFMATIQDIIDDLKETSDEKKTRGSLPRIISISIDYSARCQLSERSSESTGICGWAFMYCSIWRMVSLWKTWRFMARFTTY